MCYKTCWLGNDIKMHKMSANSIFINEIIKKKYLNTLKKIFKIVQKIRCIKTFF